MLKLDPMPAKEPEFVDTYEVEIEFMELHGEDVREGQAGGHQVLHAALGLHRLGGLLSGGYPAAPAAADADARPAPGRVKHDRKGRGGTEDVRDVLREYKHIKDWGRFCSNERDEHDGVDEGDLEGVDEHSGGALGYEIPCDENGFYAKYRGLTMSYYDAQGRKGPCEFTLS